MTTLTANQHDAFIALIREHPESDGPRLVFADALEDQGECDRAALIRIQVRLAVIGEPRVVIGDDDDEYCVDDTGKWHYAHLTARGGPDYFRADSGHFSPVGSRVDVNMVANLRDGRKPKTKMVHGLLVRKVDAGNINIFTLKRDADSIPWPHRAEHDALRARERTLLEQHFCNWVPLFLHQGSGVGIRMGEGTTVEFTGGLVQSVTFSRGFIGGWRGPCDAWCGRVCERCEGTGNEDAQKIADDPLRCRICHGSGRIPGLGPAIVRAPGVVLWPREAAVRFTDKQPKLATMPHLWCWYNGADRYWQPTIPSDPVIMRSILPGVLFDLVPLPLGEGEHPYKVTDTADAALAVLSRAAIEMATEHQPTSASSSP